MMAASSPPPPLLRSTPPLARRQTRAVDPWARKTPSGSWRTAVVRANNLHGPERAGPAGPSREAACIAARPRVRHRLSVLPRSPASGCRPRSAAESTVDGASHHPLRWCRRRFGCGAALRSGRILRRSLVSRAASHLGPYAEEYGCYCGAGRSEY
jgi:hypothetical protein